jgi:kynureninase
MPWTASLEYLLDKGIEQISQHDQQLVTCLLDGLDQNQYDVLSPRKGPSRSTLVFVSHKRPSRNREIYAALKRANIHVAMRKNKLRISPHVHNTHEDIERILAVLNVAGSS